MIYGRGSAHGPSGPEADCGGFDGITYWHRTGIGSALRMAANTFPPDLAGPGFGDVQAGMHLAGGIAAALFHRERNGVVSRGRRLAGGRPVGDAGGDRWHERDG